jgi:DMSO/TMAO reductase YedYZ molybdopterin-dependent catalytic subunit
LSDLRKSPVLAPLQRRDFLRGLLLSPAVASLAQSALLGQTAAALLQNTGSRQSRELVTANPDFFIRNHFQTPQISSDAWNLDIGGLVAKPLKLSYSDLLLMDPVRLPCTMECAGNLSGGKGVGNALWAGVSLANLLKQAGTKHEASYVIFHGADSGGGEDLAPGTHFARAIPLEKAMTDSNILAYEMNGSPLPAEHGFPLRALIAGWYGMDSVKWLTRIEVTDQPFQGYFQQKHYVATSRDGGIRPITRMLVSSKFLRPSQDEEIRERIYRVEGVAWAGEAKIAKVEFRSGAKEAWNSTTLSTTSSPYVWTRWSCEWRIPAPGKYTLEVRATDDTGASQPSERDPLRQDAYELNTCQRVSVIAR